MDKKIVALAICANVFVLIRQNRRIDQTRKVIFMIDEAVDVIMDKEIQRATDASFEDIVENYDD